jgi:hypothetical protein
MSKKKQTLNLVMAILILVSSGCALQAKIIQDRHWELNETIGATTNEQLLLNIVRLRYDEVPYFLQMTSITTSFFAAASSGVSGSIPERGPNVLGLNAGASYSEAPTVTWALPDSREFLARLHAPMGADQLTVLAQSGLDLPLVFRIGIKKMNRLRNLEFSLADGVYVPPAYEQFTEALSLMEELRKEDIIDIAYGVYVTGVGGDINRDRMDTRAMAEALGNGVQFMTLDDPNVFEMLKIARPAFVRFSKGSDDDPRARRLRELLNLDPEKYTFGIIDTGASSKETLAAARQTLAPSRNGDQPLPEIVLNNRSVMEVLRFASAYVDIPPEDIAAGIVRARAAPEAEWLEIRSSPDEPTRAWLKIRRAGTWYYIAEDDLGSRVTFTLLRSLFSSVVGEVPGSKPLLTLPVK